MKTYKISGHTNGYIASRDINFNGKCDIDFETGLTLKEAQEKLLDFFNEDYGTYFKNWGLARAHYPYNTTRFADGTYGYDCDSGYYGIVEEHPEEYLITPDGEVIEHE